MRTRYVGWSRERGFIRDPDGAYVSREDFEAAMRLLDRCSINLEFTIDFARKLDVPVPGTQQLIADIAALKNEV
jgi:hypothetical protein